MKNLFFILGVFLAGFLLLSSFSLCENPQDPPDGEKKQERHIKLVKVEDGKKTVLDTIIKGGNVFVWNGDTLTSGEDFQFEIPELPDLDSLSEKITVRLKDKNFDFDTPFFRPPYAPKPPKAPHVFHFESNSGGNIIDLSDPGIISYKKKDKSGGREKIVIIREKKEDADNEDVNISWTGTPGEFQMKAPPKIEKRIKVIKKDDGETEVFEDEGVQINSDGESVKVIEEDGKVTIKEKKSKGENEIEVEVQKKETENSNENN